VLPIGPSQVLRVVNASLVYDYRTLFKPGEDRSWELESLLGERKGRKLQGRGSFRPVLKVGHMPMGR